MKPLCAFDCETTDLTGSTLTVISFFHENGTSGYFLPPFDGLQEKLDSTVPVFHNASFDVRVLRKHGFTVKGYEDTMIMSYVWFPAGSHDLRSWGDRVGLPKMDCPNFETATIDELIPYCVRDSEICLKVHQYLSEKLNTDTKAYECYRNIDLPAVEATLALETNGVLIDKEQWENQNKNLEIQAQQLLEKILEVCPVAPKTPSKVKKERDPALVWDGKRQPKVGEFLFLGKECALTLDSEDQYIYKKFVEFNPNSSDQIAWALRFLYNWEPKEFTETGKPTTTVEVLDTLDWELPKLLVEYSETNKLVTTYGESFLKWVQEDGRIHANFNPTVTLTGRYSSSSPNLQNIPKSGDTGDLIRSSFVAPLGSSLVGCDCSNFQIRILAQYLDALYGNTEDGHALANDFNTNEKADPHQVTADLLGVTRTQGKTLNFSVLFGSGAEKMGKMMGVPKDEAEALQQRMLSLFPSMGKLKQAVWKQGIVVHDLYGRRGVYPELTSEDRKTSAHAQRQMFNFVIQATEASIMKMLMVQGLVLCEFYGAKYPNLPKPKLVLMVHDEVLFEVSNEYATDFSEDLQELFSQRFLPLVQMKGDVKIGKSWKDAH
jgi:DNA polymerase I-like protein with 3'-5' exonuclease and polymerase domains